MAPSPIGGCVRRVSMLDDDDVVLEEKVDT